MKRKEQPLNPEAPEFVPANMKSSIEKGLSTMCSTIRVANKLPVGAAYRRYQSHPDFNVVTRKFHQSVIENINRIFLTELPPFKLREYANDNNMERMVDANDNVIDRINGNIDCLVRGTNPSDHAVFRGPGGSYNPIITTIQIGSATFTGGKNIIRPQLLFKDKVDNSSALWVPKIIDKPNSICPLALKLEYDEKGEAVGYKHPYESELSVFRPKLEWLTPDDEEPTMPPPPENTSLKFIATEEELNELMQHLETVEEIAVDLEHHSYRSFQGFTCLIQITTVEGDFIVDALALREHLHILNVVFTNPKILKIFHGAKMDVQWLQRDLGVYVVGMFDTYQAACELRFNTKSLSALLKRYCGLEINKNYQLADWRLRPLTSEMVLYARTDTHYLQYIWRRMRAELLVAGNGKTQELLSVFESSRQVCCTTYRKPVLREDNHMYLYYRYKKSFNSQQLAALKMLYRWRHEQGRILDESTMYLLPNHMLLSLADNLPRDLQGVSSLCNPMPPFVSQNLITIHRMILSCRDLPLVSKLTILGGKAMSMEAPPPDIPLHDLNDNDGEESPKEEANFDCATNMTESNVEESTLHEIICAPAEMTPETRKYLNERCPLSPHERYKRRYILDELQQPKNVYVLGSVTKATRKGEGLTKIGAPQNVVKPKILTTNLSTVETNAQTFQNLNLENNTGAGPSTSNANARDGNRQYHLKKVWPSDDTNTLNKKKPRTK